MENMFNGIFGKIAPGMCRVSMSGDLAIKTSNGYKSYDAASGRLTNCNNFVFNIGEEFCFVVPTNKVKKGDIILANGKPKCVIEATKERITAINYEDSTVEQLLPERHIFMGNTYFYGKIVSMFGGNLKKGKGPGNIMKYMMLSEMMKGSGNGKTGGFGEGMSGILPLMLLGKNMDGMFDGMLDFDDDEEDDDPAGDNVD
ncbi:hypothetical protein SAMN02910369_00423 [Lachnospiraceae bacterium NE2001]|nr:hypothetical protein SAMN02910369_00423 [Lachnospiraceae bacterium NE2001]